MLTPMVSVYPIPPVLSQNQRRALIEIESGAARQDLAPHALYLGLGDGTADVVINDAGAKKGV